MAVTEIPALAGRHSEFESLLNILSGTFYRCEIAAPWRMTYVSQGVEALTGFPAADFTQVGWEHLMHPEDAPAAQEAVAEALAARRPFSVTYRLFHRSGETRWVREQGQAVYGADGEALFLEGMIADISEEQRLREAGLQSRRVADEFADQLAQVLESTSDCVFSIDREWRFTYLNGRAQEELSAAGPLLGRHLLEAYPQLADTPFWNTYQETMAGRRSGLIEAFMPGLERWYEVHAAPIESGITVFFRNIDDRKRAEEALIERQAQLKRTLDHIPQMVWSTRPDGYHDYYSQIWYEFTGAAEGETDGTEWVGMFHPDDQERAATRWQHSLSCGEPYEIEYRLRHHSGEYRWMLGRAWPERDARGAIVRWYGTCTDIHEQVLAQDALVASQKLQESVLESSADCIKILLSDGTVEFVNGPGLSARELGSLESVRGHRWVSLWPEDERGAVQAALDEALSDCVSRFSGYGPTTSGIPKWWDVVVTPIKDDQGRVTRLLAVSRDITAQRETARQIKWASEHDDLTGLPNRRAFETHLRSATLRSLTTGGEVALLLLDLDHFKHVNDTLGHIAGDHLLTVFAQRLRETIGPENFVARLGGDEFAIILEVAEGRINPLATGHAIVEALRAPVAFEGRFISAGASLGGGVFPRDANSADELFKIADIALYALKDSGRGGVRMFHSHLREEAQIAASQLSLARVAINADTVEPHYQPKAELATGRIVGLEALLRWRHGSRGLQTPDTVGEAFKDYELAAKIGDLMQRRVLGDLRRWLDRGLGVGTVSINAAPAEFLRDDFAERLFGRMAEHAIPPHCIEIEVTEHVFLHRGSDIVGRALGLLNEGGIRIALDDFGTGYSSLSYLRDFPVDVVKIDRSFVDRIAVDPGARAIVSSVIDLARNLDIDVVAEGIETDLQRRLLIEEGCRLGQGYFYGHAVSAASIPRVLQQLSTRQVA